MKKVTMRHPGVASEIQVPESAVPVHMASGWEPAQEQDPAEAETEVETLRTQATELGIEVNSRWGVPRLTQEIDAVRSAGEKTEH